MVETLILSLEASVMLWVEVLAIFLTGLRAEVWGGGRSLANGRWTSNGDWVSIGVGPL